MDTTPSPPAAIVLINDHDGSVALDLSHPAVRELPAGSTLDDLLQRYATLRGERAWTIT